MTEQNRTDLTTVRDPAASGGLSDVVTSGTRLPLAAAVGDVGLLPSPSAGPAATNPGWLPR